MGEYRGARAPLRGAGAAGRDDAGSQIVQQQFAHVAAHVPSHVAVGDDLVVRDYQEDLDPGGLQTYPVGQGPDVVAQVQRTSGAVSG